MKKIIKESTGIINGKLEELAEYLWKRCSNLISNYRFNKNGEINFTIPFKQWAKYNDYNINIDKLKVTIGTLTNNRASLNMDGDIPVLCINESLYQNFDYTEHNLFISDVMHEFTHLVNYYKNIKSKEEPKNRFYNNDKDIDIHYPGTYNDVNYLYNQSEMNARLNGAYYFLKKYWATKGDSNYLNNNKGNLLGYFYNIVKPITRIDEMEKLRKLAIYPKKSASNYMDKSLKTFKNKIYKMINSFIGEILPNNNLYENHTNKKIYLTEEQFNFILNI